MELEELKKIITQQLGIDADEINESTVFVDDLGVDSIDMMEVVIEIEDQFDIEISDEDLKDIVTVGDALEKINHAINAD